MEFYQNLRKQMQNLGIFKKNNQFSKDFKVSDLTPNFKEKLML